MYGTDHRALRFCLGFFFFLPIYSFFPHLLLRLGNFNLPEFFSSDISILHLKQPTEIFMLVIIFSDVNFHFILLYIFDVSSEIFYFFISRVLTMTFGTFF